MEKSQMMKSSLVDNNKSSLNISKSKAMYTFSKGDRFPFLPAGGSSTFYEKENTLSKRAPSFGYGNKVDISLKRNSPSPDRYTLASNFEKSAKKGLTIGHSREDCKSVSIFHQTNYPGVGNYDLDKEHGKDMTMSPKLQFPSVWASSTAPGPGAYQLQNADNVVSKFKSKASFKIQAKSPEKENSGAELLGPCTYNTNSSSNGKQVLARNKTEKAFVFSKKVRETIKELTTNPGPGAYQHYSGFGLM